MKQINFLTALPRSGTTLLGALVNHSHLGVSPHSLVIEMIYQIYKLKEDEKYFNFPNSESYYNVLREIIPNYYSNTDYTYVLDKGPWGTPYNLNILREIHPNRKFVILYRSPLECLASFMRFYRDDIENQSNFYMSEDGAIGKNLMSIRNIINSNEDYILINYNDLINEPQLKVNALCNFLEIDSITINLNKFQFNGLEYDDGVLGAPIHEVRTNHIKKLDYDVEKILPKSIIDQYKNLSI